MKIKAIDHINMNVLNLNESIKWYQEIFGLQVKERGLSSRGTPYAIVGQSGKIMLAIYQVEEGKKLEFKQFQGINHFGVEVENFDQTYRFIKNKGVTINDYEGDVLHYEKSRSMYILDPNGHEIEISEVFGGGL